MKAPNGRVHAYLPNNNLSLRLVSVWFDKDGHLESIDQAIIGWTLGDAPPYPVPLGAGGEVRHEVVARFIYDREMKTWMSGDGRVHHEWKTAVSSLYDQWDKAQASKPPELPPPILDATPRPLDGPKPWKPAR